MRTNVESIRFCTVIYYISSSLLIIKKYSHVDFRNVLVGKKTKSHIDYVGEILTY